MNRGPDWPAAGPPRAAVLLLGLLVAACQPSPGGAGLEPEACELAHTPISSVQGDGAVSPLVGQAVTVSGVVTLTEAGGYYLEQPEADAFPQTSNALYIERATTEPAVISGQWRVVRGVVAERGDAADSLTALTAVSSSQDCGRRAGIPVSEASLPLDASQREALEAMNLQFSQALVLSNARDLSRGDVVLSLDTMLPVPTEIARPGADARAQAEMNRRRSLAVRLAEEDREPVPAGSQVLSLRGVLGHDQQGLRLLADDSAHLQAPALYRVDPPESGAIRVLALNLHNYFNGDGQGQGFPTPRGAETRTGFAAQRSRLSAQVGALAPDLVAVMELENDGFGPHSAAADFSRDLEAATGAAWRVVQPWDGPIGDDPITVGLFYRADRLQPQGPAEVLDGPDFANLSRQPVAQVFADPASGEAFLVVVNHLKSKGSCPQSGRNANLGDGQACWNAARNRAAAAMSKWALSLAGARAAGRALVVGDMNAYRMEDPITTIIEAGLRDLTAPGGLRPNFSYIYWGEAGTLDYAFASPPLLPFVQAARIVNLNSPWPRGPGLPVPWVGASDHDPVVVDLRFLSAPTRD